MKKFAAAGTVALALVLTGCGSSNAVDHRYDMPNIPLSYQQGPMGSDTDWDLDHTSVWNNQTYCQNGTYNPLGNGQYSCTRNGIVSAPMVRPTAPVMPPKVVEQAKQVQSQKIETAKKEIEQRKTTDKQVSEQKKAADKAAADKKASQDKKSSSSSNSGSKSSSSSNSGSKSSSSSSSSKK